MAIDGIHFGENKITTSTAIVGKDASEMDMNDFMTLMVAQMTNQDMMNPVNDTEFIAQMAQFSSLQGINNIQEYQLASYASTYAGKYVTIADADDKGDMQTIAGLVESISFYDGQPKVQVNGKTYDIYKIMEVSSTAIGGTLSEASEYIGKTVTVSYKDEFGIVKKVTDVVKSVTIKDGRPHLLLNNGDTYTISQVESVDQPINRPGTDEPESIENPPESGGNG